MKTKTLLFLLLSMLLLLNACSPFTTIVRSSGEQPIPVEEVASWDSNYQPVTIDQIEVEVGVGSPIPVHVIVSGNLPDPCSQVEQTEIKQDGSNFIINLFATPDAGGPAVDSCIKDAIPFRMSIPLNVVDLPAGSYSVTVNGSRSDFKLDTANSTSSLRTADMPFNKADIKVDDVNIEVGVGSPIPVHAIISANLPNACAQLGEIRVHQAETAFFIQLLAYVPAQTDCNPDTLPFRLEVPLNILNLPEGPYEVNVNGATASFDLNTIPAQAGCSGAEEIAVVDGRVSYNGISFDLNPALADTLTASVCPRVLYQENQGPGEAHPSYIAFTFSVENNRNVEYQPELRIYEVAGDMSQYLFPLNSLDELSTVLTEKPEPATWFNSSPLHTYQTYLGFANGTGVRGLVQYMQDFFFYTNNGLLYEFNGLTQDGRYVVSIRYPLSVPFLMELDGSLLPPVNLNPQAIAISEWPAEYDQQYKVIEAYNTEAISRFEQMKDSDASPNIALLDALVQSIQVEKP